MAKWMGYDATAPRRADHVLFFTTAEFEYDIPYGEIVSCLPMHARYRAQEIKDRAQRDDRRAQRVRTRRARRRRTTVEEK